MKTHFIYLTAATLALSACANMEPPSSTTATHTGIGAAAGKTTMTEFPAVAAVEQFLSFRHQRSRTCIAHYSEKSL